MDRFICIHGHFYQPPRENPWLEVIERQDSASPYHDWNERVTAECYGPNGRARILDGSGNIECIANNYARLSFNFGPTLLAWMQARTPDVYERIIDSDRQSQELFSGHGSAMAQAYNHMIMPLANSRDKRTQILWGIRDFKHRFGRDPEGFWLPETAVDLESLAMIEAEGVRYTVLSPYQANWMRPLRSRTWRDVSGGRIDPSTPYQVSLPNNRHITVFFYDGPISQAVAFERLLDRGEHLANRLAGAFSDARTWPQLVHIATDGETYGHHHKQGDMGLAYCLRHIQQSGIGKLTNYGEFLSRFPAQHEAQIFENSAWSCVHGVERWQSDCGCNTGGTSFRQHWRKPLRESLDWLRDELSGPYEETAARLFNDPWAVRDEYISVILDRSPENVDRFMRQHSGRRLTPDETTRALKLLEMQRHLMLMYTSCGWFFDDLSGIETVQVLQYAGRALQLAEDVLELSLEPEFLRCLEQAHSNIPEQGNGAQIFERNVKPARTDLLKVGAHYAVTSLFETTGSETPIYCYTASRHDFHLLTQGRARIALGRAMIRSEITLEGAEVTFGVLHMGDHNVTGGVRLYQGEEAYRQVIVDIKDAFERGEYPELIRLTDRHFHSGAYTLKLLFREEREAILNRILDSTMTEAEALYRRFYRDHAPLMRFMTSVSMPLPGRIRMAAEIVLNIDLRRALEEPEGLDIYWVDSLLEESRKAGITLDRMQLEFALRRSIERLAEHFREEPERFSRLRSFEAAVRLGKRVPFEPNLRRVQDIFYDVTQSVYPVQRDQALSGEASATQWVSHFRALGELLRVRT